MVMGANVHIHISAILVSVADATPTGDMWKCFKMELIKYLYNSLMVTFYNSISEDCLFPCAKLCKILGADVS